MMVRLPDCRLQTHLPKDLLQAVQFVPGKFPPLLRFFPGKYFFIFRFSQTVIRQKIHPFYPGIAQVTANGADLFLCFIKPGDYGNSGDDIRSRLLQSTDILQGRFTVSSGFLPVFCRIHMFYIAQIGIYIRDCPPDILPGTGAACLHSCVNAVFPAQSERLLEEIDLHDRFPSGKGHTAVG